MKLSGLLTLLMIGFLAGDLSAQTGTDQKNESSKVAPATEFVLSADKLFEAEHLVDVQIELPPADWDKICKQSRQFTEALSKESPESPFEYVKGNVTIDGRLIENVGIRKKGFIGSLDGTRPSLKIKFDEYVDQDPVEGMDRVTLNNNKQDPARYCQYLSYKLFRDSGTPAPRCNFAKVTVNGDYLGIYSHVESMRKPMLAHAFEDGSGALWEGTLTDFMPNWYRRFEKKNKKAKKKHLKKLTKILAEDPLDLEKLKEVVDVQAFVRFWAMESLIGFWDGYCSNQNNFFVYRNPTDKKFYFIPWGTDSSFSKTTPLPPYRIRPMSVHSKSILCNRLYRIPEIQELYQETLMQFLDDHWNEDELLAEIQRLEDFLKDEVQEQNTGFQERSDRNRDFVSWRRKALMREFRKGPPELRSRERTPIYFDEIGTAQLEFSTVWYDRTPRKGQEIGDVTIELTLDGEVIEFEQVGAYSERSKWPTPEKVKPAAIVVTGKRKSDGKTITLGMSVADDDFNPTGDGDVEIGGILMFDNAFVDSKGRMQMINGKVKLQKTSTEDGQPVTGSMEITIMKMKGGDEAKDAADQKEEKSDPPGSESDDG